MSPLSIQIEASFLFSSLATHASPIFLLSNPAYESFMSNVHTSFAHKYHIGCMYCDSVLCILKMHLQQRDCKYLSILRSLFDGAVICFTMNNQYSCSITNKQQECILLEKKQHMSLNRTFVVRGNLWSCALNLDLMMT